MIKHLDGGGSAIADPEAQPDEKQIEFAIEEEAPEADER